MGLVDVVGGGSPQNKLDSLIVEVLLVTQPLTAKQIYYKLKKRHGLSATYQAVHKKLQSLQKEGMLKKDTREYTINPEWLDRVDQFCNIVKGKIKQRELEITQLQKKNVYLEKKGVKVKVVSLDLGGSLFHNQFDELLWRTEMPRRYAEQYKMTREQAFERVTGEYRRLWGKVAGWRDPEFWLKHFRLEITLEQLIAPIKKEITPYIDVMPIIKKLSKNHNLVIISHAQENILITKLKSAGMDKYFVKIFSTGSHFSKMIKAADMYQEICEELNIKPEEMVHLGSNLDLDYKAPHSMGINAFLIDRIGHHKEPFVVRDLYEFEERIRELEGT